MKHSLYALTLWLSIFGFAFGQTAESKQQEKGEPTLEETIKWISQNLPALAGYEGKTNTGATVTARIIYVTFDGSSGTVSTQNETAFSIGAGTAESGKYVFSLASLDPEKIVVERSKLEINPPAYDLKLNAKDGKKAIKRTSNTSTLIYPQRYEDHHEEITALMVLGFDSEETARRFEKAFKHAARLAQASSKEPF
jgi:hypothetical protein